MSIDPTLPPGKLASQLIREPDPRVVAPFVDHPNNRVRESAVGALIRTDAPDAEGYLLAYIAHSSDRYLVPRVNLRLSNGASPKAIPALAKLLHHPIEDIKVSAIDAIGRLGDSSATPIFLDALTDPNWVAKWSAMHALAEHGDLRAMDAVIGRLRQSLSRQRADNVAGRTEVSYALEYLWRWRFDPRAATTLEWVSNARMSRLHSRECEWLKARERLTDA